MTVHRAHRLTLQLRCPDGIAGPGRADGPPVEGEVVCEDGSIHAFSGWLGLVNELERVVATPPTAGTATA